MDRLITPEAVELDLAIATVATRTLGRLLDLVLQVVLLLLVLAASSFASDNDTVLLVVTLLAVFLVRLAYPVVLETRFGATLGQRAMGLRIVTDDGGPIRLRQALIRVAVGLFEIELTSGLLAFVVAAVRSDGKRIGDVAAGTLAVSVRVGTGRADVLGVTCPPGLEGWATSLDRSGLTSAHRAALRRYHERRGSVTDATHDELARALATRLLDALAAEPPPGASPPAVLAAIQWAAGSTGRDDERAARPAPIAPAPPATPPPPGTPPPPAEPPRGADDVGFAPPT